MQFLVICIFFLDQGSRGSEGRPGLDGNDGKRGPPGPQGYTGQPGQDVSASGTVRNEALEKKNYLLTG